MKGVTLEKKRERRKKVFIRMFDLLSSSMKDRFFSTENLAKNILFECKELLNSILNTVKDLT